MCSGFLYKIVLPQQINMFDFLVIILLLFGLNFFFQTNKYDYFDVFSPTLSATLYSQRFFEPIINLYSFTLQTFKRLSKNHIS